MYTSSCECIASYIPSCQVGLEVLVQGRINLTGGNGNGSIFEYGCWEVKLVIRGRRCGYVFSRVCISLCVHVLVCMYCVYACACLLHDV